MILIRKNTLNTFAIEVSGLVPSVNRYFLFEWVSEITTERESKWITTPNISLGINRFDFFEIPESDSGSDIVDNFFSPSSSFRLDLGQHRVYVYTSSSPWDLYFTPLVLPSRNAAVQTLRAVVEGQSTLPPVYQDLQIPTPPNPVYR